MTRKRTVRRFLMRGDEPVGWIPEGHRCWKQQNEPPESRAFACPECGQSWRRWPDGSWQEQPWLETPYRWREFLVGARSGMFNDEALYLDWPFPAVRCTEDFVPAPHGDGSTLVPGGTFHVGIMGDQGKTRCGEGMTFCTARECLGLELTRFGEMLPARMWEPTPRPDRTTDD